MKINLMIQLPLYLINNVYAIHNLIYKLNNKILLNLPKFFNSTLSMLVKSFPLNGKSQLDNGIVIAYGLLLGFFVVMLIKINFFVNLIFYSLGAPVMVFYIMNYYHPLFMWYIVITSCLFVIL